MISFENVVKIFPPDFQALHDLSLQIERGEVLVLLGRSGSGKTTALRLINRLTDPTCGTLLFDGAPIESLDPIEHRRNIGYAIQHIGLFLHMTVEENVGIVPRFLKWPKEKIQKRVEDLLHMVGLNPAEFCSLMPSQLSGGQKQRVGVARALAADPPIILMDEPFGALDPIMREQLQNDFLTIQSRLRKTVVFVTHDISEAMKMGDRIAILDMGKLVQVATPKELLEHPATSFIEQFLGKDRLSLLLQARNLFDLAHNLKPQKTPPDTPKIELKSTLLEALMTLRLSQSDQLAVFDEEEFRGALPKEKLLENLLEIL